MFSANCAIKFRHDAIDYIGDRLTLQHKSIGGSLPWLTHVKMNIAIADMAECDNPGVGSQSIARKILRTTILPSASTAYHLWLELGDDKDAIQLTADAAVLDSPSKGRGSSRAVLRVRILLAPSTIPRLRRLRAGSAPPPRNCLQFVPRSIPGLDRRRLADFSLRESRSTSSPVPRGRLPPPRRRV